MKIFLTAAFACFCTLSAAEKGSPDVIHWQGDKTEPPVQETGSLEIFRQEERKSPAGYDETAVTISAERLTDPGKRFLWRPTVDRTRGAGGAKIPDTAVSADTTALFLLETVGANDGPFDTRLVILNTLSGEIIRVQRFAKVRYVKILPLPDSDDLLLAEAPEQGKQQLVRLNPVSGQILHKTEIPAFSDWLVMDAFLLTKDRKSRSLQVMNAHDLTPVQQIKTAASGGILLPEKAGLVNNAQPGNPAKLERIPLPGTAPLYYKDVFLPMPKDFCPEKGMLIGNSGQMQLWMEPEGAAMIRIGSTFHRLAERVNGLAACHPESKTLYLGLQKRDMIAEFRPEVSTNQLRTTHTAQLRPATRGESRLIFCSNTASPRVLVLDHRANLYQLDPPAKNRRWKKTVLFTPVQ